MVSNGLVTPRGLGIDVVWLSPIYKLPLADKGYDMYNGIFILLF